MSRLICAKVLGGVIVADDFARLPDGLSVDVVLPDDEPTDLSPDDEAELVDRIAEADRGDTFVPSDEVMRDLRARRASHGS